MFLRIGQRVRYEGQDSEKTGLKSGMDGEIVRSYPQSVEVYYYDLKRIVHHKDFDMKMYLKTVKPGSSSRRTRA